MNDLKTDLGDLSNPQSLNGLINIDDFPAEKLIKFLKSMFVIRSVEEIIADMAASNAVKCPVHLAIGQEAVAVGVASNLRRTDRAFGNHRSHSHYLAMGGEARKLFAEVLGRYTGCSHGFGGSMHLYGKEFGFYGSVPIVAGTIPLAVGAAIAAKFDGKGDVAIAFFGDGACEEGVVHECLNMTASMNLPMIFVVENNLFSSHLDINFRQPSDKVARFAEASKIPHCTIDGNDVLEVARKSAELIENARQSNSPAFIEAVTYRWRGHVGPREDIDVGLRRSEQQVKNWKKRDPIQRLLSSLITANYYSEREFNDFAQQTRNELKKISQEVVSEPYPAENMLMDCVYAQ